MRFVIGLALICSSLSAHALVKHRRGASAPAGGGAHVLIVQSIGAGVHRYSVRIPNCGQTISHFKIEVAKGALAVSAAGMKYANGKSNAYPYSATFDVGYVSSWIAFDNFRSGTDCVTQLFVDAQSVDPKVPARLTLLGVKQN